MLEKGDYSFKYHGVCTDSKVLYFGIVVLFGHITQNFETSENRLKTFPKWDNRKIDVKRRMYSQKFREVFNSIRFGIEKFVNTRYEIVDGEEWNGLVKGNDLILIANVLLHELYNFIQCYAKIVPFFYSDFNSTIEDHNFNKQLDYFKFTWL
ncbi:MAG: hypothetical protein HRT90_06095 [Candidatus Margulisbacteria bacterium]|nr:hypothetical protein [Candidatus Margulisiibacteriota bacterium]